MAASGSPAPEYPYVFQRKDGDVRAQTGLQCPHIVAAEASRPSERRQSHGVLNRDRLGSIDGALEQQCPFDLGEQVR